MVLNRYGMIIETSSANVITNNYREFLNEFRQRNQQKKEIRGYPGLAKELL